MVGGLLLGDLGNKERPNYDLKLELKSLQRSARRPMFVKINILQVYRGLCLCITTGDNVFILHHNKEESIHTFNMVK